MNRWHRRLLGGLGIFGGWDRVLEALLTGEIYDRGFVRVHLEEVCSQVYEMREWSFAALYPWSPGPVSS